MPVVVYANDPVVIDARVRGIIRARANVDLGEYIEAGLMLINGILAPAGYSQDELATLHAWLAAHFYEVDYQRKFKQVIGKTEEDPETKVDLGLNLTRPGQQVMNVLDYKQALSKRRARVFWAGNPRPPF